VNLATALGALWGLLVAAWVHTATAPRRLPATYARRQPGATAPNPGAGRSAPGGALTAAGRLVRRLAAAATQTTRSRANDAGGTGSHAAAADPLTSAGHTNNRRTGIAALGALLLAGALHPLPGLAVMLAALVAPRLQERRHIRRRTTAVVDQLPDVVDLLRLTALAGLPVSAAISAIGRRPGGVVGEGLQGAATRLSRGASTADALGMLAATCGPPARSLVDALIDHDRYGTPLVPVLDRMAVEYRLRRRQQAEEAARRLPVTLLFPLVLTTLPACALLTVVPLLVASVASLQA
jgi:tight adherence protein C